MVAVWQARSERIDIYATDKQSKLRRRTFWLGSTRHRFRRERRYFQGFSEADGLAFALIVGTGSRLSLGLWNSQWPLVDIEQPCRVHLCRKYLGCLVWIRYA